jgi:pilus assembly protein CpaB
MRSKSILVTLFLVSVIVLGAILWRNAHMPTAVAAGDPAPAPKNMILVAAQPLRTGTLLRAEDVKWQGWNDEIPAGAVARPSEDERKANPDLDQQTLTSVYGAVLRQRMDAGQPIASSLIVKPGDRGFLAAVLAPGYRAIAIGVTPVSGAAGLIFPGDHVDVLLTQSFAQGQEPISRRSVSETIVANLRVLAIDQRLQQATADPNQANAGVARTVTLEVLPKQAEMISVASQLGALSLTLRSVPVGEEPVTADNAAKETVQSTWADDVSPALKPQRQPPRTPPNEVHVIRGDKIENVTN